jgi:hypothetical protein
MHISLGYLAMAFPPLPGTKSYPKCSGKGYCHKNINNITSILIDRLRQDD